ncbi:GtrA family protein [Enterococcus sp. BWB1-3]|uniref:GtrA family protein n=1 Tax=unclassified Enterococcus TaxID=2608891 RepID=UPI001920D474|nr:MULTISPECIES: GtrA family protein [unclassified Enterococcus]MBL1228065.1 GtrA family protein [Enterococcus sp. BWB1-3]MCB5951891.1 GtrA family protein [Enterococcus sp. BWT-B8]MCB5954087.1 GtrA family protein [Enterococcus sp. CWB-B31]
MKGLFQKYKEVVAYLFFGVATTVINLVVYFICTDLLLLDYKLSNVISWFLSVLFAFFTNKYFVFQSLVGSRQLFWKEMFLFYWYRILSFVIDMGVMLLLIEVIHAPNFFAKLVTQVIVVVLNYFFSKFLIFRNEAQ